MLIYPFHIFFNIQLGKQADGKFGGSSLTAYCTTVEQQKRRLKKGV
jgi:hypothetical protein